MVLRRDGKEEKEEFCDVITTGSYVNRVCRKPTLSGSYELIGKYRYEITRYEFYGNFRIVVHRIVVTMTVDCGPHSADKGR
jgi:hypothetical protein